MPASCSWFVTGWALSRSFSLYRGKQLAFASTVDALRAGGFAKEIDEQAVADYLEFGFVTEARTIYANVARVPAASILEWSDAGNQDHAVLATSIGTLAQSQRPILTRQSRKPKGCCSRRLKSGSSRMCRSALCLAAASIPAWFAGRFQNSAPTSLPTLSARHTTRRMKRLTLARPQLNSEYVTRPSISQRLTIPASLI